LYPSRKAHEGDLKMMVASFDLKQVVIDLRQADPDMSREELFDHCMRIGTHNGMPVQQIIDELMEILKENA